MFQRLKVASLVLIALLALITAVPAQPRAVSAAALPTGEPTPTPVASANSINPLTGLPVDDPSLLALPPALISVSNFPVTARPQTGLSTSPLVFEIYIGEGMTRFLALFYGDFAKGKTTAAQQAAQDAKVGPVRSGRVAYEDLRTLYDGFLIMSGAYSKVAAQLNDALNVCGSNPKDINSAGITLASLQTIAEQQKAARTQPPALNVLKFASAAPSVTSDAASQLEIDYNYLNRVQWTYDAASGAYLRAQDAADASGKFYPSTDKMTGKQLGFDNVVVLFADHVAKAPTLITIQLVGIKNNPALLFRDGKVYQATWKSYAPIGPIRLFDQTGQPLPYKPGNTWFEVVTRYSTAKPLAAGQWKVHFSNP